MVLYNNDSNDDSMLMMIMMMNYLRLHGTPRANVDDGNTIIASDIRRSPVFLSPLLLLLLLLIDHIDTFKETDILLRSRRSILSLVVSSSTEQSVCTCP